MKIFGYYLLTIATLGQFAFVWVYLMVKEASLGGQELARDLKLFVPLYVLYCGSAVASVIYREQTGITLSHEYPLFFYLVLAVSIYLVWLLFKWLLRIATHFRRHSVSVPSNFVLFLLFCFGAICLPVLQSKFNALEVHHA
jgi:uncharacterized membrane protein YoaK (UPF0700 family)